MISEFLSHPEYGPQVLPLSPAGLALVGSLCDLIQVATDDAELCHSLPSVHERRNLTQIRPLIDARFGEACTARLRRAGSTPSVSAAAQELAAFPRAHETRARAPCRSRDPVQVSAEVRQKPRPMLEADLAFGPSIVANGSNTSADTVAALGHDVVAVEACPRRFAKDYAEGDRKVILTVPQAAQYLGLAPKTLRGLARKWLNRLLKGAPLAEIDSANIAKLREIRRRQVGPATVNRDFAELRAILNRAATDWKMLDAAPKVPMYRLQKIEPRWEPRERIHALLGKLPPQSRDMAILACATGMRRIGDYEAQTCPRRSEAGDCVRAGHEREGE